MWKSLPVNDKEVNFMNGWALKYGNSVLTSGPVKCGICDFTFSTSFALELHAQSDHSDLGNQLKIQSWVSSERMWMKQEEWKDGRDALKKDIDDKDNDARLDFLPKLNLTLLTSYKYKAEFRASACG